MRRFVFISLFVLIHYSTALNYEKDYSPLLDQSTSPSNPGIFLRLMPTGLAYLREIGMKVVNEQILRLPLPTIRERIENGEVSIHNAYISKYWAPQEYSLDLVEPNMFTWSMSKMHISSQLGAPQVASAYCKANIGYVDLNVRNTGVITDFFINAFKTFIIGNFKPMVEDRMCGMIQTIVDKDMNGLLATMPLKVGINENNLDIIGETFHIHKPKSKLGARALQNLTLMNFVQNLREKSLVLDYQLTSEPFISLGAIAIMAKGEISWKGTGGTPFYPPLVHIPPPHGVHMIEFVGTDYIANSMLYHAYRQRLMDITVGPESTPQLKDLLHTTCDGGFCIGEFLGSLGEKYPKREVEIIFNAKKAPLIVFVENRARFRLHGRMNMYARPANATQKKELVLRSDTTMTANVLLWINGTRIVGNSSIENLDFKLLESRIEDVDQSVFGDLGLFGAEFLEQLLTEILQLGITMPTMNGVVLKSPKLSFHDRYLKVQTYFKLDENYAGTIVQGAVKQTLQHVG